jgi:5-formyltetrahydrofolate cyclo-ligase
MIVEKQIAQSRYDICKKCDKFLSTKQCKECLCFMPLKVKFETSNCPLKKWEQL